MLKPSVVPVATMDTKFREAGFIESCLKEAGCGVQVMDAGFSEAVIERLQELLS